MSRLAAWNTNKRGLGDGQRMRGEKGSWGRVSYSHLEVRDELSHGDFLRDLLVQTLAVQDHALQNGQGPLKDGHVHHGLAHVPCNLQPVRDRSVRKPSAQECWTAWVSDVSPRRLSSRVCGPHGRGCPHVDSGIWFMATLANVPGFP